MHSQAIDKVNPETHGYIYTRVFLRTVNAFLFYGHKRLS